MIGGLRRRARSFFRSCRWYGVRPTLHAAWRLRFRRGRRTLLLFGLSQPKELRPAAGQPVVSRLASREDVARLVASGALEADSLALLDAGDACLLQFVGDRLAGRAWLSSREEVELFPGLFLRVPADAGYVFRTWTEPEMRGHGLQPRRTLTLLEEGRRRGRHRLVCFVESTNLASLKGIAKAGYRRVARLHWAPRRPGWSPAALRIESPDWRELQVRIEANPART